MKKLAIIFLILSLPAHAATLLQTQDTQGPEGDTFNFSFSIKNSTPLSVTKFSCYKTKHNKDTQQVEQIKITEQEWNCFENEVVAKIQAQLDADKFEKNYLDHGYGSDK